METLLSIQYLQIITIHYISTYYFILKYELYQGHLRLSLQASLCNPFHNHRWKLASMNSKHRPSHGYQDKNLMVDWLVQQLVYSSHIVGGIGIIASFHTLESDSVQELPNLLSLLYLFILSQSSFAAMDFIFTGNRKGANELFANNTYLNNNLFMANMESLAYGILDVVTTSVF